MLVTFNKKFISACAFVASANSELRITSNRFLAAIDRFFIFSFFIIFIATTLRLLNSKGSDEKLDPTWVDLLTLNYLPRLGAFGRPVWVMLAVSIGPPVYWKLYLNISRPLIGGNLHRVSRNYRSLKKFFLEGPHRSWPDLDQLSVVELSNWPYWCNPRYNDSEIAQYKLDNRIQKKGIDRIKESRKKYLSRLHEIQLQVQSDSDGECDCVNPIKAYDYLADYSERRWRYLFAHVYIFCGVSIIVDIPVLWIAYKSLSQLMEKYSWLNRELSYSVSLIYLYGFFEMIFCVIQINSLLIVTNVFITLFYADLKFKLLAILQDMEKLKSSYSIGAFEPFERTNMLIVKYQQLRIWAYFENIKEFDTFVSKFSLILLMNFIVGIIFAHSYSKLDELALKSSLLATCVISTIAFAYLCTISWGIEQKIVKIHRIVHSILARDSNYVAVRTWHKILELFFEPRRVHAFTMNSQFPLNLVSFMKLISSYIGMSLLMKEYLHRNITGGNL